MKNIIFGIVLGFINVIHAALPYCEYLDLESVSSRLETVTEPSPALKRKLDCFLKDPAFSERSVVCALEERFPELPQLILCMEDPRDLLKAACHLKRLHFLSPQLKEAYENIFYSLEFVIERLSLEDTHRVWSCISGCGYHLPPEFLRRLDTHTARRSREFSSSLLLSTLWHTSILPEGRAWGGLVSTLSRVTSFSAPDDFHNFMILKAYITEVKDVSVAVTPRMDAAIKVYQEHATYSVTISASQAELASFLTAFDARFACEFFYESLDTHFDIANEESKIVVDMDGFHHYKEDLTTLKRFRRPVDLMRDAILLRRGWKVYRIRPDEWNIFKKAHASEMTERSTLEAFYETYAVSS
jgi:hypothetical protein